MSCDGVMLHANQKVTLASKDKRSTLHRKRTGNINGSCAASIKKIKSTTQEVRMNDKNVGQSCDDTQKNVSEFVSSNLLSSHHAAATSDMGNLINVDDWFKQRTESSPSLYLDTVMKHEVDVAYLSDNIECIDSNNFLSSKDSGDMCLVTNICDMSLGLDLSTISQCEKTFDELNETDCNATNILNDYQEQESLLLSLTNGDLLDKESVLVGDTEMVSSKEMTLPTSLNQTDVTECNDTPNNMMGSNEQLYTLSDGHLILSKSDHKDIDENNWIDNLEMPSVSQSLTEVMDSASSKDIKQNWDSLSLQSQQTGASGDLDSEKDFPEFNFLSLQTDPHGIAHSDLPPIDLLEETEIVNAEEIDLQGLGLIDAEVNNILSKHLPSSILPTNAKQITPLIKFPQHSNFKTNCGTVNQSNLRSITKKVPEQASQSKQKSLLKQRVPAVVSKDELSNEEKGMNTKSVLNKVLPSSKTKLPSKQHKVSPTPRAIIAISTDKSKNTTEVTINTSEGKQIYKGKTSELMRMQTLAQAGCKTERKSRSISCNEKCAPAKLDPLFITGNSGNKSQNLGTSSIPGPVLTNKSLSNLLDDFMEEDKIGDEQIMESLKEVGITEDNLFRATVESGLKLWVCPISDCGTLYTRLCVLKLHILAHFNIRPYKCDFEGCKWSFYKYFKLKRHKETHENRKDYECPVESCSSMFTTIYNLKTHLKLHARPAEMVCPVSDCCAKFQTKRKLEVHMKVHDTEYAPYKCSYTSCGKHYYSSNALNSHLRSHQHKEEELRCQYCEKMFTKPCRLRFHLRTHTGDKPFLCTFEGCKWAFTTSSKLTRHMYKHTNERKFQCPINNCSKSFMRSEHLKEHELTHRKARLFSCPMPNCSTRAFQAKSSLYVHLKKHRELAEDKPKPTMTCPVENCSRTYTCKYSFRNHMSKAHYSPACADLNHMDYIALLTGDEEVMQLSGDNPSDVKVEGEHVPTDSTAASTSSFLYQDIMQTSEDIPDGSSTILEVQESDPLNQPEVDTSENEESSGEGNLGAARTRLTFELVVQMRCRKDTTSTTDGWYATTAVESVVPESGLLGPQDIAQGFLLQDDMMMGQHFLYHEDHFLSAGSGVGEYQVLLLDTEDVNEAQESYAESTINLRDLE